MPNLQRQRDGDHRHQHQLEEYRHAGGEARPEQAFEMQAGAGHQEADSERGTAERVRHLVPESGQRNVRDVEREPDRAGPDQRIARHGHDDRTGRALFRRGVVGQHRDTEHVDHRDDGDHRDRCDRQPEIAEQAAGDGERDIGLPAGRALEDRGKGGTVNGGAGEQGAQRKTDSDIASADNSSAPPTPPTGTVLRSALTSVCTKKTGSST